MQNAKIKAAADALADALHTSEEYAAYTAARELAFQNPQNRAFYHEYRRLQVQVQANSLSGKRNELLEGRLQHAAEFLHFDEDASAFLAAEYTLNAMLSEVYRMLAKAVDAELSFLDA